VLSRSWTIAAKDLRLVLAGGQGLSQAALLGLLLIFVFSLATPVGQIMPAQGAAAIFWLSSAFGLVLIFNTLYGLEESGGARIGLLLAPVPVHAVWLGKAVAGLALLLMIQIVFGPAVVVFLGQDVLGSPLPVFATVLAVDWGLAVLGSLLGALSQGQAGRESLLSVALFPLLVPVLLAGIRIGAGLFAPAADGEISGWLGLVLGFDAMFTAAAVVLFPFVFTGEE
jgi:heme exporter protein B